MGDERKMNDLKGIIEDCNKSDLVSDKIIKKVIEIIGQEEWQDLHDENNDICTTMGELIITLKRIAELEKENAELKERIQTLEQIKKEHTDYTIKVEEERTSVKEQLTKAKEIIKDLLGSESTSCEEEMFFEIRQKAEQFIKDNEVEK